MILLTVRAVRPWHPTDPKVQEVVAALEAGAWAVARAQRPAIEAMAARLDEDYLVLYGAEGDQNTPAVIDAFSRARALDVLVMALGVDETMAAKEALYEAYAALDDPAGDALLTQVRSALATA